MNTALIKTVPPGDFEEVSIHTPDWCAHFLRLVQEGKRIRYGLYTMPNIPKDIQDELSRRSYRDLILEDDQWQHFLVPPSA